MTTKLDRPRVIDNGRGAVIVTFDGQQIRAWSYQNDDERRRKMLLAHEYIEGWCDSRDHQHAPSDVAVVQGIHIREKLLRVLSRFNETASVREKIVEAFWPMKK
jgi:hypothetical protein